MRPKDLILGEKYRDTNTGYEGVAISRTEWQNGCWRITLERADKDGKPETFTFDLEQLEAVSLGAIPKRLAPRRTGGARSDPSSRADPSRRDDL